MAKSVKPVQAVRRTMVKRVNVNAPIPIRTVTPYIYGRLENVSMSPSTILKCLIGRATVHEILSDGTLLKLNEKNYNTENKPAGKKVTKPGKVAAPKSAISSSDVKTKRILITDETGIKDKVADIKPVEGTTIEVPEVKLEDAKPEEIKIESKPNLNSDDTSDEVVMVEYSEPEESSENASVDTPETSTELASEDAPEVEETAKVTEEVASEEEDPELAEIAAEIAKLEAEEATSKTEAKPE